jgi:GTP-binding protein
MAFRREKFVPRGGPSGGDGGHGGDVVMESSNRHNTLVLFRYNPEHKAERGEHGMGSNCTGKDGEDVVLRVPVGTSLYDDDTGELVHDFRKPDERVIIARGGRGGRGNQHFATPVHQAPREHEEGRPGEEKNYRLELKLLADVGLVGYPNAGKSTLISRISAAKPKIADYPFTTLVPNLGVVRNDDGDEFVVADIPGLIEGASEGKGLGHQFLRHIERARVLAILVDLTDDGIQAPPAEQLRILLQELGRYRPELLDRPRVVIGSKADLLTETELAPHTSEGPDGEPRTGLVTSDGVVLDVVVSAVTGQGLARAVGLMADATRHALVVEPEPEAFIVYRPVAEGIKIERSDDGGFRVIGRQAQRAVALSDLTNPEALDHAHSRLRKLGVDQALAKAGAKEGDLVHIGGLTFTYDDAGI